MNPAQQSDASQTVIRYPWRAFAVMLCLLAILLAFYGVAKWRLGELNDIRGPGVLILIAMGPLYCLGAAVAMSRRKLVITSKEVIYRPAIGRPRETRFAEVRTIEKGSMMYLTGITGSAVILTMKDGEVARIPLDLKKPDDVFNQLQQYVETHKRQQSV